MPIRMPGGTIIADGCTVAIRKLNDGKVNAAYRDRETRKFHIVKGVMEHPDTYADASIEDIHDFIKDQQNKLDEKFRELASGCGLMADELLRVWAVYQYSNEKYAVAVDLLTRRNRKELRGTFMNGVAEQLYLWSRNHETAFTKPLTEGQWEALLTNYRRDDEHKTVSRHGRHTRYARTYRGYTSKAQQ